MKVKRTIIAKVKKFQIGDEITFKITDNEKVKAIAVQEDADGNILFIAIDCLIQKYPMYNKYNENGYDTYEKSDLRKHLNDEIFNNFPNEIKEKMVAFDNGDMLSIPTEKQIFGVNENGKEENTNIEQFPIMEQKKNRIAFIGYKTDAWGWYWLKNKHKFFAGSFCLCSDTGANSNGRASSSGGIRLIFKLKNNNE